MTHSRVHLHLDDSPATLALLSALVAGRKAHDWVQIGFEPTEHGLLDLAPSEDTRVLIEQLGPGDRDVVLDPAGEAALRRCVDRILATWHDRDPLALFLY